MTRPHLVFILSFLPFYPIYQTTQHLSLSTLFTLSFASPCAILFNLIRYIHGGAIAQLVVPYRVTTEISYTYVKCVICGSLLHVKIFCIENQIFNGIMPTFFENFIQINQVWPQLQLQLEFGIIISLQPVIWWLIQRIEGDILCNLRIRLASQKNNAFFQKCTFCDRHNARTCSQYSKVSNNRGAIIIV